MRAIGCGRCVTWRIRHADTSTMFMDEVTDASVAQMSGSSVLYVAIRTACSNGTVGFCV